MHHVQAFQPALDALSATTLQSALVAAASDLADDTAVRVWTSLYRKPSVVCALRPRPAALAYTAACWWTEDAREGLAEEALWTGTGTPAAAGRAEEQPGPDGLW